MADAEIRASWTRRVLRVGDRLPDGGAERFRKRIDVWALASLENAGPLAWLPATVHAAVTQALCDEVGAERYRALYRDMTLEGLSGPLFGPLARGAIGLFGRGAAGLERMFPKGWSLVARGCGRLVLASSKKGFARMVLDGIPEVLSKTETYALGFAGAFDACRDFVETKGTCVMDASRLGEGLVSYELEWEE